MADEVFHDRHDPTVVGRCAEHEAVIAEGIFHCLMKVIASNVRRRHPLALFAENVGKSEGSLSRVAIDGAVGDEDTLVLWLILAPCVVGGYVVAEVLIEHRAMERADALDVERCGLLQELLHHGAIFADDVEVVATSFACPALLVLLFLAESTELAEAVGCEECLGQLLVCDHNLWPVYHRSHEELESV